MKSNHQSSEEPKALYFDLDELGARWHCHRMTAYRRLQRLGVKALKLSERAVLFHADDIARVEADCMTRRRTVPAKSD